MSIPSARSPGLLSDSSSAGLPFLQHIRRFRSRGDRLRAAAKGRQNSRLLEHLQEHLNVLECVDALGDRIEDLAREFIGESPGFHLARRLFDGRYMVEMAIKTTAPDALGRNVRELSRLAFLLSPEGDDQLLLECHATVRDHDLPIERLKTPLCRGAGAGSIEDFLDEQFLGFARAYYDESA